MTDAPNDRRTWGDYEIETMIGKGSIGRVYLARHRRIGRRAALKVIDRDQHFEDDEDRTEFNRRLQREAELCGSLQHPNIVTLYEAGYDGEVVSYLATEYVAGESLQSRLKRTRPLPLPEALSIASDVLRGLAYAHAQGVIHRDIKPANILLSNEGHAKITDFGIARPLNSSLTGVNSLLGTPNYMSPEQVKSTTVTPRSDLYSAGVVMYEMLTGVRPFAAPALSGILFNVVNLDPPQVSEVNPAVPQPISDIVAKLLAKMPVDRYASAGEALADVERQRLMTGGGSEYATIAALHDSTTPLPTIVDENDTPEASAPAISTVQPPSNDTPHQTFVRRPVPAGVFWSVTLVLIAALATSLLSLQARIRSEKPTAVITQQQADQALAKKHELAAARSMVSLGRYDDAIARYDAYLAKYPESVVARDERAEAQRLLDESTAATAEVTTVAKKKTHRTEQAPPRRSRWERFKSWLRQK